MHQRLLVSSGIAVGRSVSSASIGFWCPGCQFEVPRSLEACQLGWMTVEFNYRERPVGSAVALRTSQVRTTLSSNSCRGMLVVGEPTLTWELAGWDLMTQTLPCPCPQLLSATVLVGCVFLSSPAC